MKNLMLFTLFIAMISCNSDSNNTDGETSLNSVATESAAQKTNFSASCLSEKIENFPDLISNARMFEITGKTNSGLTQNYVKVGKGVYQYSWDGETGRKMTLVNGMIVDAEDAVSIIITSTKSSVESFKRGYYPVEKSVSNKQNSKLEKEVELALKGQSSSEKMNENVVELREQGMSDEEIMKTYTGITKLAEKTGAQKEIALGVGEAAVWDRREHQLMVNADNMTFWVTVILNEDHKKDLAIAKKITNSILEVCD